MLNQTITLVGNVGSKMDTYLLESGNKVVRFTTEVKQFASQNPIVFHIEAWNELADQVNESVKRGQRIAFTGKFKLEQYTRSEDGSSNTTIKPVITLAELLSSGKPQQTKPSEPKSKSKIA